jgi:hypothetical protein
MPERQTESSDAEMSGEHLGTLLRQLSKTSIDGCLVFALKREAPIGFSKSNFFGGTKAGYVRCCLFRLLRCAILGAS